MTRAEVLQELDRQIDWYQQLDESWRHGAGLLAEPLGEIEEGLGGVDEALLSYDVSNELLSRCGRQLRQTAQMLEDLDRRLR